jgi:hypothetical protein
MFELHLRRLCLQQNLGVGFWRLALACFSRKFSQKMAVLVKGSLSGPTAPWDAAGHGGAD